MRTSSRRKLGGLISWPVAAELLQLAFQQQLLKVDEHLIKLLRPAQALEQLAGDHAIGQRLPPMKQRASCIENERSIPEQRDRHQQIACRGQIVGLLSVLPLRKVRAQHRQVARAMGAAMPQTGASLIGVLRVNDDICKECINAVFCDFNNQLQGPGAPRFGHLTQVNSAKPVAKPGAFYDRTAVQPS